MTNIIGWALMNNAQITTWKQIKGHLDAYGVSEESLRVLWEQLDIENLRLADIEFRIEGVGYDSSIRSDFATGIIDVQRFLTRFILCVIDDNPYRLPTSKEKELFAFYLHISKGSTKGILRLTEPIMNAIARKIDKMNKYEFIILALLLVGVWKSPGILEALPPIIYHDSAKELLTEREHLKIEPDEETKAAQEVIQLLSQNGISLDKEETKGLLEFAVESREKATRAIVRNTAAAAKIQFNDSVYDIYDIARIKDNPDKDIIPTDSEFIDDDFLVTVINRKDLSTLKLSLERLHHKTERGANNVFNDVSLDIKEEVFDDAMSMICRALELRKPLHLNLLVTKLKDGKITHACIVDMRPVNDEAYE